MTQTKMTQTLQTLSLMTKMPKLTTLFTSLQSSIDGNLMWGLILQWYSHSAADFGQAW